MISILVRPLLFLNQRQDKNNTKLRIQQTNILSKTHGWSWVEVENA